MFPSKSLLSLLFVFVSLSSTTVAANLASSNSITTLEITRHRNVSRFSDIVGADRARARALKSRSLEKLDGHTKKDTVLASNTGMIYTANIGIGNPPTQYTLAVDTGCASTWVGANPANPYVKSKSSLLTGRSIAISGANELYVTGPELIDTVTLSSSLVVTQQFIFNATSTQGVASGIDGYLGISPMYLSAGTVVGMPEEQFPTVMNNLWKEGTIQDATIGIYFAPISAQPNPSGQLSFGGPDLNLITGDIQYIPPTQAGPANRYWGFDMSISYGALSTGYAIVMELTAGIVDTGHTGILLATEAYQAYVQATGAVLDSKTNMLTITQDQYNSLGDLVFNIGSVPYVLIPNGQIWPRSLNGDFGGDPNAIYLVVSDLGSSIGQGLDFILGHTFMERFYVSINYSFLGFATTAQTGATTN